jgi:hypothetical protein
MLERMMAGSFLYQTSQLFSEAWCENLRIVSIHVSLCDSQKVLDIMNPLEAIMAVVGYVRFMSVGQSLDVQLDKLKRCDSTNSRKPVYIDIWMV